jgi:hypothetical protein
MEVPYIVADRERYVVRVDSDAARMVGCIFDIAKESDAGWLVVHADKRYGKHTMTAVVTQAYVCAYKFLKEQDLLRQGKVKWREYEHE